MATHSDEWKATACVLCSLNCGVKVQLTEDGSAIARTRGDKLKYMLDFAECKGAVVGDGALAEVEAVWQGNTGNWIATLTPGEIGHADLSTVLAGPIPNPAFVSLVHLPALMFFS